jgi:hypothetical protein
MPDANRASLYLEAAKSLFYLITVLVIGALITAIIKSFDTNRKADKALHEFRVDILHRLQETYQRIEKARHLLRVHGLTDEFGSLPLSMDSQAFAVYIEQMAVLQEVQSDLKRLILEVGHFQGSFSASSNLIIALEKMKQYVCHILDEYERHGRKLLTIPGEVDCRSLGRLIDFTGKPQQKDGNYSKDIFASYDEALVIVRDELLPLKKIVVEGGVVHSLAKPD